MLIAASLLASSFAAHAANGTDDAQVRASPTLARSITIAELFPPAEAARLESTLRADKRVDFRLRIPPGAGPHGALVFVHPYNSGELPDGWAEILDRRDLAWVAAEKSGNAVAGSQRALVALLGLTLLSRTTTLDDSRRYIGGMSGGGKIAGEVLTRFPAYFDGALCIVGANPVPAARLRSPELREKRVLFLTGDRDFNHYDVLQVYGKFRDAGLSHAQLVDLRGFGHQYPDATQLDAALELLDPRS
ncbi:MAG TPA: hypothetical protein VMF52_16910 [Steroidobacteraceae bacterium]|nr:hypothetical protein [Steroidobacteraceae bacterium]